MAYKVFTNGSVLNASEVNDNLMNQAVITFSNGTARGSALASPVQGMLTYLEDTDTYEYWDGAAWVALVGASGSGSGNAIINGAFEINQRNLTSSTSDGYGFDRWVSFRSGGTATVSSQAFTLGSAPLAGLEAANFLRIVTTSQSATGDYALVQQPIEGVRTFAGQTVTVSFYAKSASGTPKIGVELEQGFGTGGSPSASVSTPLSAITIGTSWTRYTATVAVPSIAGKTVGTNNNNALNLVLWVSAGATFASRSSSIGIQNNTFDIWGVQVEAGSTATDFRRNANSIEGELAACQRYFVEVNAISFSANVTSGQTYAANYFLPVTLRTTPTLTFTDVANTNFPAAAPTSGAATSQGNGYVVKTANGSGTGFFSFNLQASAEL